ncbi:hypothetical protein M5K25_023223 [Dendrobium thyrsiflorum]|uniref:Uncharacterized protein n=1 Tax=Dendrobium thyrsiflorum TaxID=117978 RepID=A0ABD0U8A0_DENTH
MEDFVFRRRRSVWLLNGQRVQLEEQGSGLSHTTSLSACEKDKGEASALEEASGSVGQGAEEQRLTDIKVPFSAILHSPFLIMSAKRCQDETSNIQTLYFFSGGATTLIFMLVSANAEISLLILLAMLAMVDSPLSIMFPYKSFLISTSHFMIELYLVS